MRLIGLTLATLALSAPVSAASEPAPAEAPAPAPAAKPKKICRPVAGKTGSNLGSRRACRTADEWRERDRADVSLSPVQDGTPIRSERSSAED